MTNRPHLRGETALSLATLWPDLRLEAGIARRILSRVVKENRDDLDGVSGLSPRLAAEILRRARLDRLAIVDRRRSAIDPFVKYLFRAPDGALFESVRIPLEKPRWSVCVSTQVGCALGCAFCETGRLGFGRDLEAWEIVEQVVTVRRESTERPVSGVVFQGQGEPMLNYENVIRAAQVLSDPSGGQIRGDRFTISTVGIPAAIDRFREERHPYRIFLSLGSTFPETRERLMPVTRSHPLDEVCRAVTRLCEARNQVVTIAWVLVAGVNTSPEEAGRLQGLFPGRRIRVSLIDVNDPSGAHRPPGDEERGRFLDALESNGIGFVRRYSGGSDISAACGQLVSSARGGVPLEAI